MLRSRSSREKESSLDRWVRTTSPSRTVTGRPAASRSATSASAMVDLPAPERPVRNTVTPGRGAADMPPVSPSSSRRRLPAPVRDGLVAPTAAPATRRSSADVPRSSRRRLRVTGTPRWPFLGEPVQDEETAVGGPVRAIPVGPHVVVEDGDDAAVQFLGVLGRQVQGEPGERPHRVGSGLLELLPEGVDRCQALLGLRAVQGSAEPPGETGRPVGLLDGPAGAGAHGHRLEEAGVDEPAHVVEHRPRVLVEPVRQLLVGQLLVGAQPQDPQSQRVTEGLGLAGGRLPALSGAAVAVPRCRLLHAGRVAPMEVLPSMDDPPPVRHGGSVAGGGRGPGGDPAGRRVRPVPLGTAYWRLWTSSGLSNLADGALKVALPLVAVDFTRSPVLVAGVTLALTLPWLLVALPVGALADRLDRRHLMLGANAARALLLAGLVVALAFDLGSIWVLYVVAFGLGAAETVYDTSAQSILPAIAPRAELTRANGRLYAVELTANQFVGPPLGGVLVAAGATVAFATPMGLWLAALGALLLVPGRFRVAREGGTSVRADVTEGLRFLGRHRLLRTLAVMVGVSNFASSAVFAVFVLHAVGPGSAMGLSEQGYGLLLTTPAGGSLLRPFPAPGIVRVLGPAPIGRGSL